MPVESLCAGLNLFCLVPTESVHAGSNLLGEGLLMWKAAEAAFLHAKFLFNVGGVPLVQLRCAIPAPHFDLSPQQLSRSATCCIGTSSVRALPAAVRHLATRHFSSCDMPQAVQTAQNSLLRLDIVARHTTLRADLVHVTVGLACSN